MTNYNTPQGVSTTFFEKFLGVVELKRAAVEGGKFGSQVHLQKPVIERSHPASKVNGGVVVWSKYGLSFGCKFRIFVRDQIGDGQESVSGENLPVPFPGTSDPSSDGTGQPRHRSAGN